MRARRRQHLASIACTGHARSRAGQVRERLNRLRHRDVASLAAAFAICALSLLHPGGVPASTSNCSTRSVGIDTSAADGARPVVLGAAQGQTFLASDSLVRSITVWRISKEFNTIFGMHLYLVATDSTGRPDNQAILLDGPTLVNNRGDGVHPTPFTFLFDPPIALPRRGRYAFFIKSDPCNGFFHLLDDLDNGYSDGTQWEAGSTGGECGLAVYPDEYPAWDLVFTVEFCDASTGVQRVPWGRLKIRYR